jgi:hypothetical protein
MLPFLATIVWSLLDNVLIISQILDHCFYVFVMLFYDEAHGLPIAVLNTPMLSILNLH